MSRQVKLSEEAYEVLAAAEGANFSERVMNLGKNSSENSSFDSRLDKLGIYLEKRFNQLEKKLENKLEGEKQIVWEPSEKTEFSIPSELEGLAPDELPLCCQGIFAEGKPTCPHWEEAWVKEFGNKVIGYRNTLTGRTASDEMYHKYV